MFDTVLSAKNFLFVQGFTHVPGVVACAYNVRGRPDCCLSIVTSDQTFAKKKQIEHLVIGKVIRTSIECTVKCLYVSQGTHMCRLSQNLDCKKLLTVSFQVAVNAFFSFRSISPKWRQLFLLHDPNITACSYII